MRLSDVGPETFRGSSSPWLSLPRAPPQRPNRRWCSEKASIAAPTGYLRIPQKARIGSRDIGRAATTTTQTTLSAQQLTVRRSYRLQGADRAEWTICQTLPACPIDRHQQTYPTVRFGRIPDLTGRSD